MKKRFIDIGICLLAAILILTACGTSASPTPNPPAGPTLTVRFLSQEGEELRSETCVKGTSISEPAYDSAGRTFIGWYKVDDGIIGMKGYGSRWEFDKPVEKDMTLRAFCVDALPRAETKVAYQDFHDYHFRAKETNAILVIYLNYTDGHEYDEWRIKEIFEAETEPGNCLSSVSSYYKYNSYGKADFDFYYFCYDTGMTCKEAYDYEHGGEYGLSNNVIPVAFSAAKQAASAESWNSDRDGDGYADTVVILSGEDESKTVGDGQAYRIFGGSTAFGRGEPGNVSDPVMRVFTKMAYADISQIPVQSDSVYDSKGPRVLIHELGHVFGLYDYYDMGSNYSDFASEMISTLGGFDMQEQDVGDWNPFSKFSCGWVDPYVIKEDIESVTLKLGSSSLNPDVVLIPTSKGWNGTAFDEYILIDVMSPDGNNGFDWKIAMDERLIKRGDPKRNGGVRIYHVDARLVKRLRDERGEALYSPVNSYDDIMETLSAPNYGWGAGGTVLDMRFLCSNGNEPTIQGDSPYYHLIEIIPSDGTDKYWKSTETDWSSCTVFSANDLFGPGEAFSVATCGDVLSDAPYMNNGGTFDYEIIVEHYDAENHEAIVTIRRVR